MMGCRRWCPAWSKKFPSFYHDPESNHTFCRLCRNSNIPHAKMCSWALGLTPPSSGWRMRKLVRHLSSFEHQTVHEMVVELCDNVLDYQKKHGGKSPKGASNPASLMGEPDVFNASPSPVTFQTVLDTLTLEELTRQAHCAFDPEQLSKTPVLALKELKKRRKRSIDFSRPSMVVKAPKIEVPEILPAVLGRNESTTSSDRLTLEIATTSHNFKSSESGSEAVFDGNISNENYEDSAENGEFTEHEQNGDSFDGFSNNLGLSLPPSFD
uniref:Uncharacterized protein n=1 Tax=Ciona savignyi TaxID=51511 RepID=H2YSQ1_CIOSA